MVAQLDFYNFFIPICLNLAQLQRFCQLHLIFELSEVFALFQLHPA